MRQAADSGIIQTSMKIRNGEVLQETQTDDVMILPSCGLEDWMITWADVILTSTNKTRIAMNQRKRELLGFRGAPQSGDSLVCLKNYWDILDDDDNPLVNGTICKIHDPMNIVVRKLVPKNTTDMIPVISGFVQTSDDCGIDHRLNLDPKSFNGGESSYTVKEEYQAKRIYGESAPLPLRFDFGYAMTTHKFQGSSAENVLVIEEGFPFDRAEHIRHLYTSCTRPEKKLIIIKK